MMRLRARIASAFLFAGAMEAYAFAQTGEVQREHDARIKTDTERNTKYHNNADDYSKNTSPTTPAANGSNYVPVLNAPYQRKYEPNVESAADHRFIGARQRYLAGDRNEAAYILGESYYTGAGTKMDKELAFRYWSGISDNPQAEFRAGRMQWDADGIYENKGSGFARINHAALKGSPDAKAWLSAHGFNQVIDPELYASADAELDRARDMMFGPIGKRDLPTAVGIIKAKAIAGYPRASYYLGRAYEEGLGVPKDEQAAYHSYQAAESLGDIAATKRLSKAFWNRELGLTVDSPWTEILLKKVAGGGDTEAMYMLGEGYTSGSRGVPFKVDEGVRYFQMAAEHGSKQAEAKLADAYYRGQGVPQDFSKAAQWAERAHGDGQNEGTVILAYLYRSGSGVTKDQAKSLTLMKLAATSGSATASGELAKGFDGSAVGTFGGTVVPVSGAKLAEIAKAVALPDLETRLPRTFAKMHRLAAAPSPEQIANGIKAEERIAQAMKSGDATKSQKELAKVDWTAATLLGRALMTGQGVPIDYVRARNLLSNADQHGSRSVKADLWWAIALQDEAAHVTGDPHRDNRLQMILLAEKTFKEANPDQACGEVCYLRGVSEALGVFGADLPAGEPYLLISAQSGVTDAQIELAYMLWEGRGIGHNDQTALEFMTLAARTDPDAMYALGTVYANGLHGVSVDRIKANALIQAAAAQGQTEAKTIVVSP